MEVSLETALVVVQVTTEIKKGKMMRRNYRRKPKNKENEKCVCNYIINTDNSKGK